MKIYREYSVEIEWQPKQFHVPSNNSVGIGQHCYWQNRHHGCKPWLGAKHSPKNQNEIGFRDTRSKDVVENNSS